MNILGFEIKAYRVIERSRIGGNVFANPGEIVFEHLMEDCGVANLLENETGQEHISVTRMMDGDWPFFTVPAKNLEEL